MGAQVRTSQFWVGPLLSSAEVLASSIHNWQINFLMSWKEDVNTKPTSFYNCTFSMFIEITNNMQLRGGLVNQTFHVLLFSEPINLQMHKRAPFPRLMKSPISIT